MWRIILDFEPTWGVVHNMKIVVLGKQHEQKYLLFEWMCSLFTVHCSILMVSNMLAIHLHTIKLKTSHQINCSTWIEWFYSLEIQNVKSIQCCAVAGSLPLPTKMQNWICIYQETCCCRRFILNWLQQMNVMRQCYSDWAAALRVLHFVKWFQCYITQCSGSLNRISIYMVLVYIRVRSVCFQRNDGLLVNFLHFKLI